MRRRRFLVLIVGAVGSLPLNGAAQQAERLRRVAVLISFPQTDPYLTGFASYDTEIIGKWLQLLKEAAARVTRVAIMFNPDTAFAPPLDREIASALSFGVTATLAPVHDDAGIEAAIETEARHRVAP
jgi:hypothetical protein